MMDVAGLPTEPFEYRLDFEKLQTDDLILRQMDNTLGAGPVREESLLSSWPAPNWIVEGGRVRQIRSRAKEYEIRRGRLQVEFDRSGESGDVKPFVLIQNPPISILAFGNWQWTDVRLRGIVRGGRDGPSGIAFRYRNGRHYYAVTIERGAGLRIMLRSGDNHHELARIPLDGDPEEYRLVVSAQGDRLEAGIENGPTATVRDSTYAFGKCALVCEGESTYGTVDVRGSALVESGMPLPQAPEMKLLARGELMPGLREGRVIFHDVDGDGLPELVGDESLGTRIHCQHLVRGPMWTIGTYEHPISRGGDLPLYCFDLDGDGRRELVFTADFGIHIHDALSGGNRKTVKTPPANHYRDDDDPHQLLLGDALRPMITKLGEPPGFYIKDRYWNLWVYDCHLNLVYHKALNTGHHPLPVRIRADEPDYLVASRSMLSPTGDTVWDLALPDHSDAIGYFALRTRPRLYIAAGEEGLLELEPHTGEILTQLKWGHVQLYSVGRFIPDRAGYQILTTTQWREPGVTVLLDDELNLIERWMEMSAETGNRALPWGVDGADLAFNRRGIRDPRSGRLIRPLPDKCGWIRTVNVLDLPGYGPGCLMTINEGEWQIWGPGANVPPVPYRYRPNAMQPSGYLPILDF